MFWNKPKDPLDEPILWWAKHDPFTRRDLVCSVAIFGQIGSGKSSASGFQLAKAIVRGSTGGLILCSKPEDKEFWQGVFAMCGRTDDLLIFEPGGSLRCNFLDFLGGDVRNTTQAILTIAESLKSGVRGGGDGDSQFWEQAKERTIYNGVQIVRMAEGSISASNLRRFIVDSPHSMDQLYDENWRRGYHAECFNKAGNNIHSDIDKWDFELARDFWVKEWPQMGDKTRSGIEATVNGVLHVLDTGIVRQLISTTTNASPAVMDKGKFVLVNMPIRKWGESGKVVMTGWKFITQTHVLARTAGPDTPINVIWCDEAQNVINGFDFHYLSECRSHKGAMVYLTQSIHAYLAAMKGHTGHHEAEGLLTSFGTKIVHTVGDAKTAEYASGLLGKRLMLTGGGGDPGERSIGDELTGRRTSAWNWHEEMRPILEPREFMSGLRHGGPPHYCADAYVIRSGAPFSNEENYLRVAFNQK